MNSTQEEAIKMTATLSMALSNTLALMAPTRTGMRTGGPDNDEDEDVVVARLLPILAAVIALAAICGG